MSTTTVIIERVLKSPAEYWPLMLNSLNDHEKEDLMENYVDKYDLPYAFWNMDYFEFLEARRKLMAESIKNYFEKL